MEIIFTLKNSEQILLRTDAHNYELCQTRVRIDKATGDRNIEWEPFKWFSSLEQALNRILDLKLKASDVRSLEALKKELLDARTEITASWRTSL